MKKALQLKAENGPCIQLEFTGSTPSQLNLKTADALDKLFQPDGITLKRKVVNKCHLTLVK